MAFRSILGNKGRSVLTMLGIIIGIASVMTIVSTINGMNQQSLKQFEAMGTNKITVSAQRYDGQDVFQDLYDYCLQLSDYLGSDQYAVCNNFQIEKGRDLSFLDIQKYNQVCVLGAQAARNFFGYADPVGQTMSVNGYPFTVVGVYREKDPDSQWSQDNIIVFPYTMSRILSPGETFSEFSVKARSAEAAVEATSRISGYLTGLMGQNQEKGYFWVDSNNQWQNSYNEQATMMSVVLGGIAAISLLVGGIGIMNIMLVTVTERTREIGIRRAIGAERSSIVTQFLIEAAMLCGIGGIIGIAFGTLATRLAGRLLIQIDIWPSVTITLGAFALSVALGVLFGIYPAAKASKLQPVEALRAE